MTQKTYNFKTLLLLLYTLLFYLFPLFSQDLMLQGWYWDYPKTCTGGNWAVNIKNKAQEIKDAGFTYVWLPPLSRASFGNCSVGYDPKDLYDLGEAFGGGPTGFGTRNQVNNLIQEFNNVGLYPVADVIYNHRDGGQPETNSAVKDYITIHYNASKAPFPSDRYHCILPIGGSTGKGAGNYYFKISSKSGASSFYSYGYKVYTSTNRKSSYAGTQNEDEINGGSFNGGSDCGQGNNTINLNYDMVATLDNGSSSGCFTDEFKLTIDTSDFYAAGDTLYIYLRNTGGYSDHRIYGIWYDGTSSDIVSDLEYQTYTDFTNVPSGQGLMNFENFKPNTSNTSTTYLSGDWDGMWFFYDYDQFSNDTKNKLFDYTTWLWNDVGIRGYRMDAVKHFTHEFVGDLMDHLHDQTINPGLVVGEVYDANPTVLKNWLDNVYGSMDSDTKSNINVRVFDFSLREALKNGCDAFGYDTRNIFNSSLVDATGASPFQVVTFINNHDFRDAGQPVQNDVMLAYAYLLTNNKLGIPCVFFPEYYGITIPNAPLFNLKPQIDSLWNVHKTFITGSSNIYYLNAFGTSYTANYIGGYPNTSLIYQISGNSLGKDVVVAINFAGETLKVDQQLNSINVNMGDTFTDVLGNSSYPFAVVNGSDEIYMELPARSYSVWVKGHSDVLLNTSEINTAKAFILQSLGNNKYKIESNSANNIEQILVIDELGNKVFGKIQGNLIDVNSLPTGVYFIQINNSEVYKVVKI